MSHPLQNEPHTATQNALPRVSNPGTFSEPAGGVQESLGWVASLLTRGFTQIYAVQLAERFQIRQHAQLLEHCRQRTSDPTLAAQVETSLHALAHVAPAERNALLERLRPILFDGVDRVLEQAQAAGRDRTGVHLAAARFGHEVIILADHDPQRSCLLPAAQARLCEALAELGIYPTAAEAQTLDLEQGDVLQILGVEFRGERDPRGRWRVQYRLFPTLVSWDTGTGADVVPAPAAEPAEAESLQRGRPHASAGEGRPTPASKQIEPGEPAPEAGPVAGRAPVRWRLRWPWPFEGSPRHHDVTGLTNPNELVPVSWRKLATLEVGWRHLPIALYPLLGVLVGWNSPLAWMCLVALVAGTWRSVPAVWTCARRHWMNALLATGGVAVLVFVFLLARDIYANRSQEVPARQLGHGFYRGRYNPLWFGTEPVHYGLYVPPHFESELGPRPLLVFLHGYGERTTQRLLMMGFPQTIQAHFGAHSKNGRFNFVLFLPRDPTGKWEAGTPEVENVIQALDFVIQQHRIDPARVYLTGLSNGGNGVWDLAAAYPDKWAALAPVSASIDPDIDTVRHIPAWIFHATHDRPVPVERDRRLFQRLKAAKADVRYTEVPVGGHVIWREAYDTRELYDWFLQKVRR